MSLRGNLSDSVESFWIKKQFAGLKRSGESIGCYYIYIDKNENLFHVDVVEIRRESNAKD